MVIVTFNMPCFTSGGYLDVKLNTQIVKSIVIAINYATTCYSNIEIHGQLLLSLFLKVKGLQMVAIHTGYRAGIENGLLYAVSEIRNTS